MTPNSRFRNGPDVAPWVTMALTGTPFGPITTRLSGAPTLSMPDMHAELPLNVARGVAN
jgi:hypothetical protein